IAIGPGNANADVAARARGQPPLAGPVADVDQVLLQVEDAHTMASIGDDTPVLNCARGMFGGVQSCAVGRSHTIGPDRRSIAASVRVNSMWPARQILDRSNTVGIGASVGTGRVCRGDPAVRVSDERSTSRPPIMPASRAEFVKVEVDSERILLGRSDAMRRLWEQVQRIAPAEVSVLITGETGTGKELVARILHRLSQRASKEMVALDCNAVAP